jgi:hypothetical protein
MWNSPPVTLVKHYVLGERLYSSTILDLGTRWRWLASRPGRFTSGEMSPGTIG